MGEDGGRIDGLTDNIYGVSFNRIYKLVYLDVIIGNFSRDVHVYVNCDIVIIMLYIAYKHIIYVNNCTINHYT